MEKTGKPTLSVSTGGTVAGESAILAVRFCEMCGFHAGYWERPHYWITENAVYQSISYYIISSENCTKFGRMIIQRILNTKSLLSRRDEGYQGNSLYVSLTRFEIRLTLILFISHR